MAPSIALRCRCGSVRGELRELSADATHRIVCYCSDCRAFARHLARLDVLDAHGGTEILQLPPAHVRFTQGDEQLRCLQLAPGGLLRFHSACCRTPLGNSVGGRLPLVGVPIRGLIDEGLAAQHVTLTQLVGPPAGLHGREATGGAPVGVPARVPPAMIGRILARLLRWGLSGQGHPSPYFDDRGRPRQRTVILGREQREQLRRDDHP